MVDDKQFIIIPSLWKEQNIVNVFPNNTQREIVLSCGFTLIYEKHLHVCCNKDCTGVLIGDAWQVDPSKDSPESIIKTFSGRTTLEDVYNEEKTWCGRYVLIVNNWLFLDFCGTLGVFYTDNNMLSSSFRILCEQRGTEVIYPDTYGEGVMNFVPGPLTPSNLIRRLMPNEIININTGERCFRPLSPDGVWSAKNDKERTLVFEKYFTCSLRNMARHIPDSDFWLALTGGVDSRTLMALLECSRIEYKAFTCWHESISEGDLVLPPKLAEAVHVPYKFIERRSDNYSPSRAEEYRRHTGGMADDADKPMYVYGQYQELDPQHQVVLLRSGIWEHSCNFFKKRFTNKTALAMEKHFDIEQVFPTSSKHELYRQSFCQWQKLREGDTVNKDINIWDLLYLEQRLGAWLSSIEQGFDLMEGIVSVQCCNSRLFFSILTGFPDEGKNRKEHEMDIVRQSYPILSKYMYESNLTLKKRIKNVLHDLKMRYL